VPSIEPALRRCHLARACGATEFGKPRRATCARRAGHPEWCSLRAGTEGRRSSTRFVRASSPVTAARQMRPLARSSPRRSRPRAGALKHLWVAFEIIFHTRCP